MMMSKIDFDNLPESDIDVESIVNSLDSEETISLINVTRQRHLKPSFQPSEREIRLGVMLTRRLRALRETKTRTSTSQKAKAAPVEAPKLDDL